MLFDTIEDLFIEHEDVAMRFLMHTLERDVREWFYGFPNGCIGTWDMY